MAAFLKGWLPCLVILLVQLVYAVMHIINKLALNSGMDSFVLLTYRQILATLVLVPFTYYFEWHTLPAITRPILFHIFLCSLLGATLNQSFYIVGLKYSTPTIASAISNLFPGMTFIIALLSRLETLSIMTRPGQAKMIGTLACIGGAMLMSFYHGKLLISWKPEHCSEFAEKISMKGSHSSKEKETDTILGPLLIVGSCVACAGWFILQDKLTKKFLAPYTTTALMSFMAIFQCGTIGVVKSIVGHKSVQEWALGFNIRLLASLYSGAFVSAFAFSMTTWCIEKKGPLYVAMFSPLVLIIVAIVSCLLFHEKIYVGTLLGATLIVAGLYTFIWGKNKEKKWRNDVENKGQFRGARVLCRRSVDAAQAESHAILEAVKWANELKLQHVIFESEATEVIFYLQGKNSFLGWENATILNDFKYLTTPFLDSVFLNVGRFVNGVADFLSKFARNTKNPMYWNSTPPAMLLSLHKEDLPL